MTPACQDCRFWQQHEGKSNGCCRRFPPVVTERVGTDEGMVESSPNSGWPLTDQDEWCGEFRSKEIKPTLPFRTLEEAEKWYMARIST